MSRENKPIVTKHGLNLVARYQMEEVPALSKMIIVGAQAESVAAEDIHQWKKTSNSANMLFLHRDAQGRFAMDPAFEDLSKQEDVLTAKFAAKRLEYRATDISNELYSGTICSIRNETGYYIECLILMSTYLRHLGFHLLVMTILTYT